MSASILQSLDHFLAIGGLFGGAIGVAFYFAALKIKGEMSLEIANQLRDISVSQVKGQFEDSRLAQLLLDLKEDIDTNRSELAKLRQEIETLQGFLATKGYGRRRRAGEDDQP